MRQLLLILSIIAINIFGKAQNTDNYNLVWSDEFNKKGRPDSSKWNYEIGFVRNEELQWYQPENDYCKKGYLIIKAKRNKA